VEASDPQAPADRAHRVRLIAAALGALALLVVLAIILDLGPFADDALSEEEFLSRGDEICATAHEGFADAQSKASGQTPREAVALTDELIEIAEQELADIEALAPPEQLADDLDRYLAARERGLETLREGRAAAEKADIFAYESAQAKLARGQAKRLELAKAVGFSECSTLDPSEQAVEADAEPPSPSDPSAPPTVNNPPTGSP
jgi:hypothetical protein